MKEKKNFTTIFIVYIILLILIILLIFIMMSNNNPKNNIEWDNNLLIGHSFGSIGNDTYTGSYEAFQAAYDRGVRTFEVDLNLTNDNKVVLAHDFDKNSIPTEKEFLATPIKGKYTPMSFKDLLELMNRYEDIYIVTDTKFTDKKNIEIEFNEMLKTAQENDLVNVFDRFIIQIYNKDMYDYVQDIYNFKSTIFTLYMIGFNGNVGDFEQICSWCKSKNIKSITMWSYLYNQDIKEVAQKYNIDIYVHTVNDVKEAKKLIANGVRGIYTDSIGRNDLISKPQ